MELQREKDRVVELTNETKKFKALKQVNDLLVLFPRFVSFFFYFFLQAHAELQEKYACVQETVSEQEIGLVEMGRQLSL